MAYLLHGRKESGPYPCYAGEYCGNHHPQLNNEPDWQRVRQGKPRSCPAGSSAEMAAMGFVGLYLRRDFKPYPDGFQPADGPIEYVPTPDCLKEPA